MGDFGEAVAGDPRQLSPLMMLVLVLVLDWLQVCAGVKYLAAGMRGGAGAGAGASVGAAAGDRWADEWWSSGAAGGREERGSGWRYGCPGADRHPTAVLNCHFPIFHEQVLSVPHTSSHNCCHVCNCDLS